MVGPTQRSCALSNTHWRESWKAAIVKPGTLCSSRLSMYFSTTSVCARREREHEHCLWAECGEVHAHSCGRRPCTRVCFPHSPRSGGSASRETPRANGRTRPLHVRTTYDASSSVYHRNAVCACVPSTMPWSASTVRSKAASSSLLPLPLVEDSRVSSAQPFTISAPYNTVGHGRKRYKTQTRRHFCSCPKAQPPTLFPGPGGHFLAVNQNGGTVLHESLCGRHGRVRGVRVMVHVYAVFPVHVR